MRSPAAAAAREVAGRDDLRAAGATEGMPMDGHRTSDTRQAIRRQGEFWTIVYEGRTCRLRDTRGLTYLVRLLRAPYSRLPAFDLVRTDVTEGRPAPAPDAAACERARVNVTRALGSLLRRLETHHPELAKHLRATVRTGAHCVYTPDPRLPIDWETDE